MATEFKSPAGEQVGRVVSRLPHPVIIKYGSEEIRLSSRGQTENNIVRGLLGKLPTGTNFVAR